MPKEGEEAKDADAAKKDMEADLMSKVSGIVDKIFEEFDKDNSGSLDKTEARKALAEQLK